MKKKVAELNDQHRISIAVESLACVDSELMCLWWPAYELSRWQPNPLYWKAPKELNNRFPNTLMTCRLDGPTADIAKRLVDDAVEVGRLIQWEYSIDKKTWHPCELLLNKKIEISQKSGDKTLEFESENREKFIIEFRTNTQHKKNSKDKSFDIRRENLKNRGIGVPENWMKDKTLDLIPIDDKTREYQDVIDVLKKNKYGNHTILSIERIQNKRLYIQYTAHKKSFQDRKDPNGLNEKTGFHRTGGDTVENIWKGGFNRSYCGVNGVVYGKGSYFARDACYSHNYTNLGANSNKGGNVAHAHLFVCKVLVGYNALGNSSIQTQNLPKAPDGITPVDSTVNNTQDPSIFVIYHDAQAYPEYLVTYQ